MGNGLEFGGESVETMGVVRGKTGEEEVLSGWDGEGSTGERCDGCS